MKATQSFRDHFLPKRCIGKRTLRESSTTGKKDNIVLIEVDCDDLGDVIILDVPESFQEKFRKHSEHHVIKIDDEDGGESRAGVCDMDCDATTSTGFSSKSAAPSANYGNMDGSTNNGFPRASAACTFNCADFNEECLFVNEGNIPVKLSKSKRTYSGKALSGNQHGSDYESLSESDCSDCEFMDGSFGELRELWEKASSKRRRETICRSTAENKAGTSAANQPGHHSDEESTSGHSEPAIPQSTSAASCDGNVQKLAEESKFFKRDYDAKEMDEILTGIRGNSCGSSDIKNKVETNAPDQPVHERSEQSAAEATELHSENHCFWSCVNGHFDDSPEKLAEESKNAHGTKGTPYQDFENDYPAFLDRDQSAGRATIASENSSCGHKSEAKSSLDQNIIVTDRQKIKETDEYKRAMEEEEASRQQQLQLQAEEAQRLRSRKRAEKMRIMANERRQKQRLEEIRETRRKDEENLNLKDKLRAQIKKELCKLETMCGDMASLLRCLGIHVGGGPFPSPNEVQAAYKRACLKFHPDRLSTTDLRQQVEAEEKFKLISNMKEKFSTM